MHLENFASCLKTRFVKFCLQLKKAAFGLQSYNSDIKQTDINQTEIK